jgi:hypothetical protein
MPFVLLWCKAFALTLAVETPLGAGLLGGAAGGRGRRVAAAAVANLASHPAVWFVFPELGAPAVATVIASELWAFASEVLIYRLVFPALSWRRVVLVSAAANGASFAVGVFARRVLQWP